MQTQVKLVLLAGTSGLSLAQELEAHGAFPELVQGDDGVPKVLLGMNGTPVLNYWMESIADCPRLHPLHEKVSWVSSRSERKEKNSRWGVPPSGSLGALPLLLRTLALPPMHAVITQGLPCMHAHRCSS